MSLFRFASRTPVLLVSFAVMAITGAALHWVSGQLETGEFLDFAFTADAAAAQLGQMSDEDKRMHVWSTSTLDLVFPLAIAVFLSGAIIRFRPPRFVAWLAWLPIVGAGLDLLENATIVMVLGGRESLLGIKSTLTICKFAFLIPAFGLAIVCFLRHFYTRNRQ